MTKEERHRIESFRHIGCIVSGSPQYDVHHITDCGRRLGDSATIPLHPWFHRAFDNGLGAKYMTATYGPSLELDKAAFVKAYGTELELLEKTNKALESFR